MLPTNSTSSVPTRRIHHRRQQSLEVPILVNPSAGISKRNQLGQRGHRRGLSLDQSLIAIDHSAKFRPLHLQDRLTPSGPLTGSPQVRIRLDSTNTGQLPSNTQHYQIKQETQQQSIAQPGYQAQDFQSHLQQQLSGVIDHSTTPIPLHTIPTLPHQQDALQKLQHHLDWYRNMYGVTSNANMGVQPFVGDQVAVTQIPLRTMTTPTAMHSNTMQVQQEPMHSFHPSSGSQQARVRTVPSTPQPYTLGWPSPPPSHPKQAPSQSFQLDAASMSNLMQVDFAHPDISFADSDCYASSYSSSHVDPASPVHPTGHMPTLFEESTMSEEHQACQSEQPVDLLLDATNGPQDFNDPNFDFGAAHITAVSPRQALLNQLGPDIPASIVETGVQNYEVQQYIGEFDETDKKYPCMYHGCTKRFGRKENVRAHVQTHLGDRQFKCDLCEKTFVRQHDLKRHITIHSDDRPHGCVCGQSFARHDALTRHRQRGMCVGTLPGFEKDPADMPKRGRPKKQRPEMEDRVEKATKTRKYNTKKADSATDTGLPQSQNDYASSNYSASDRSFPVTPPDTSDAFDADDFLNMAEVNQHSSSPPWKDTPPTSPTTGISPAMLLQKEPDGGCDGWSSPAEFDMHNGEFGAVGAQPDVYNEAFSPPGESMTNSSVYGWSDSGLPIDRDDHTARPHDSIAPSTLYERGDQMSDEQFEAGRSLVDMLDNWLNSN